MATQAERDYIIQQATARNPSNPQLALWEYAQSIGFSPAQIDDYMGWSQGTSQNWAQSAGLMQPTYGVQSQGEGEITNRTADGYVKTVGDKNYYYDNQGNFLRGYRDAGNGWTAPINVSGTDIGTASNTSRDNSLGATINNIANDPLVQAGLLAMGGAAYLGAGGAGAAGTAGATGAGTAAATDAGIYGLSGGVGTLGAGSAASTGTAMATGGLGLTAPAAVTGATLGSASAAGTAAAAGGLGLAGAGLTGTAAGAGTGLLAGAAGSNLIPTALTTAGGLLNAEASRSAAQTQADAQIRAAQIAADAAKFRPVGVTTNFGSSQFGYDANGNLTSAGYNLAPGLQAAIGTLGTQAQGLLNQAGNSQSATAPMGTAAQRAMTLGQGYLATDPQAQAAKYLADQQGLLAPSRAADMAALQATMQAQGRGGFAMGGGVNGQGAANPQLQALLNAQMQQDAQLSANATQGGMDYAKFGMGMVGSGGDMLSSMYGVQNASYQPLNTALGTARDIESMGQNAMNLGMDLGGRVTNASANAAGMLNTGMTNAASTIGTNAQTLGSNWGNLLQGAGNSTAGYRFDPMTGVKL